MRKIMGVFVGACLFGVLFGTAWAAEPIKIGYLATLTGEGATWGAHERDGALLAVEEINAAGGVLGRPLELVAYDVRGRAEDAINAARRLIEVDKVVAIGGTNYSGLNIAIGPIVEKGMVPQIGTFSTNPTVTVDPKTQKPRPYSFRICYTDPYQGKVMAEYFFNKLNVKKAAIIHDIGSEYSEGLKEYFIKTFKGLGGEIVGVEAFRSGDVDFRAQITNLKKSGAEGIALPLLYKEMALIIKQAAEMGWKPYFIGGDGYSPNMYEICGDAMEGSYWVYHLSPDDPILTPLKEKFKKRFNAEPTEIVNTVAAYDLIQWVADSIKRAGKAEGPAVRDAIESAKDLKLLHFTLTLDKATHNPLNKPAAILRQEKGALKFLETYQPQTEF